MIGKNSKLRILMMALLAIAVTGLCGCSVANSDPTAVSSEWANLSDFIAEFVRATLAAWAL